MDEQNISQECVDELNMTDSLSMGALPDVFYGSPIASTSTYPERTRTRYRPGNIMDTLAVFQRLQRMRRQAEMNRTPPAMYSPQRPSPRAVAQQGSPVCPPPPISPIRPSPGSVIPPGSPVMPAASTPRKRLPLTKTDINLSYDLLCPFEFAPHEPERPDLLLEDVPDTLPAPLITAPLPRHYFQLLEYVEPLEEPGQVLTDVSMEFPEVCADDSMGVEDLENYIREEARRGLTLYENEEDEEQKLYALGRNWSAIELALEDEEAEISEEPPSYLSVSSLTPEPEVLEASLGAESFPSASLRDSTYSTIDSAGQLFVEDENEPGMYTMPKITRIRDPAERFRVLKYLKDRYFGDLTQSSDASSFLVTHVPKIPAARRSFGGWRQPREEYPRRLSAPPALYRILNDSYEPSILSEYSISLDDASMGFTPPRTPELDVDIPDLVEESMPSEELIPETPHISGIIEPQDAFSPRAEEEFRNATRRFLEVKYNDQMYYPSHIPDLPDLADVTPPFIEPGRRRLDFSGESDILGSTFLEDEGLMDITSSEGRADSTFSTIPASISAGDLFVEDENEPGRYTMPLVTQIQDPTERFKRLKFLKDRILTNLTESSADSSFLVKHVPEIPAARRSFGGWRQPRKEFPRRLSAPPALYRILNDSYEPSILSEYSISLEDASMGFTPPRTPELDVDIPDLGEESMPSEELIPETPHISGIIEPQDAFTQREEEEIRNATRRFLEVKYNDEMYYPSQMFAAIANRERLDDEQLALDSFGSSGMLDNLDISLADDSIPEPSIRRLSKRYSFGLTPPRPRPQRRFSGPAAIGLEKGPRPIDPYDIRHEAMELVVDDSALSDLANVSRARPRDVRYSFGMTPPRPRPRRRLSGSPRINLERGRISEPGPLPLADTSMLQHEWSGISDFIPPPPEEMFRTIGMPSRRASFGGATGQRRIFPGGRLSGPPEMERVGGFDLFEMDARRPVTDIRYSFGMTPPRPRPRRRLSGPPGVNLERGRRSSAVPLPLGDTSRPLLDYSSFEVPPYEEMFRTIGRPGRRASFGGATGQQRISPGGRLSGPPEMERAGGFDLFDLDARRPVTDIRYSFGMTPPRPRPRRRLSGPSRIDLERGRRSSAVPLPLSDTSRPLLDITSPEFVTPPYEEMFKTIGIPGRRASFGGATGQGRICPGGRLSGPPELERAGGFDLFDLDARRPVTDIRYSFGMTPPRPRPRRRLSGPSRINLERGRRSSAVPLPLSDTSRPLLDITSPEFVTPPYEEMFKTIGMPGRRASFGGATGQDNIRPGGRLSGPPELERAGGFDLFDLDARRPVTDIRYSFGMTPPRPRPRRRLSGPPGVNLERGRRSSAVPLPLGDTSRPLLDYSSFEVPPYEEMFRTIGRPGRRASFGGVTGQQRIRPGDRLSGPPEMERAGGFDLFDLDARRPVTDIRYSFGMTPPRPRPRRRLSGPSRIDLERGRRSSAVPLPLSDTSRPLLDITGPEFVTPPYAEMFRTVDVPERRVSFGGVTSQSRVRPAGRLSGPPELETAGGFDLFDLDARRPVTDIRYSFGMTPPRPRPRRRLSGPPRFDLERGRRSSAGPLALADTSMPAHEWSGISDFVPPSPEEMFRTIGMPQRRASFGGATGQRRVSPGRRLSGPEAQRAGGFDLFELDPRRPVTDVRYSFGLTPPRRRHRRRLSGPPGFNLERGRPSSLGPLPINDMTMSLFEEPSDFDSGVTGQPDVCPTEPVPIEHVAKVSFINITSEDGEKQVSILSEESKRAPTPSRDSPDRSLIEDFDYSFEDVEGLDTSDERPGDVLLFDGPESKPWKIAIQFNPQEPTKTQESKECRELKKIIRTISGTTPAPSTRRTLKPSGIPRPRLSPIAEANELRYPFTPSPTPPRRYGSLDDTEEFEKLERMMQVLEGEVSPSPPQSGESARRHLAFGPSSPGLSRDLDSTAEFERLERMIDEIEAAKKPTPSPATAKRRLFRIPASSVPTVKTATPSPPSTFFQNMSRQSFDAGLTGLYTPAAKDRIVSTSVSPIAGPSGVCTPAPAPPIRPATGIPLPIPRRPSAPPAAARAQARAHAAQMRAAQEQAARAQAVRARAAQAQVAAAQAAMVQAAQDQEAQARAALGIHAAFRARPVRLLAAPGRRTSGLPVPTRVPSASDTNVAPPRAGGLNLRGRKMTSSTPMPRR